MAWRNRPLMRRQGDVKFKTGTEASELLIGEATRRDQSQTLFLQTFSSTLTSLAPVFDRNPKYAWIAKQLIEPERLIQFRVAWLDDTGILRMNRGIRIQYSSTLGPYEGSLHFGPNVDTDFVKAVSFDTLGMNAVAGMDFGGAAGGADFDPSNKSEAEIQRFCQSFMTELSKHIGPDHDMPSMGIGVGEAEIGYMYGQYKRIKDIGAKQGSGFLWGGRVPWRFAYGHGVAHFAERMLRDKKETLQGKRVLITGSGNIALGVAERLLQFGAIPITFSDSSGHIYEQDGIDASKLATIKHIKSERGARLGRYIVASTTAKYSDPEDIFSIPCDICIPCGPSQEVTDSVAQTLIENGCKAIVEGGSSPCTPDAIVTLRRNGILFAPYKATLSAGAVTSGGALQSSSITTAEDLDRALADTVDRVYSKVQRTASEFNTRGDLLAGTHIAGFIKVANGMMAHGAV